MVPREPRALAEAWVRAQDGLERALAHAGNTHDAVDVLEACLRGDLQMWAVGRSALVTEVLLYPKLKAVRLFLAGGDLRELKQLEAPITEWARALGAARLEICGREGWQRIFAGARRRFVTLTREI